MATNQLRRVLQTLREAAAPDDGAGLSDGQLLESYVRGREEAAFAALVRRHGPMVWGVCRRVLRVRQDAEDAFQATFLVLVRKAAAVASKELVANWLYGVAHRTALKARTTAARRRGREKQVTAMPEPAAGRQRLWDELEPLLDQELGRLPDKYRAVLVLCDLEGKTRKEAARHFHLPEGTVGSRLATARALLAKRLARHGPAVSGAALAAALAQNAASANAPAAVVDATILAASLVGAGQTAAAGLISARALTLAEGVLKTMLLTKLKIATAVLAAAAVLVTGAAALSLQVPAAKPPDRPTPEKQVLPAKPADQPVKEHKEDEARPAVVSGVATAVDAEKNTLRVAHREGEGTFTVAKDARIDIDGKSGRLAGLPKGANVTLSRFVGPKTAGSVQASGRWYFGVPVKAVDARKNTITVKDREDEKTFAVAQDAFITVDGKPCKLAAVPPGAFVSLGLAADQTTARTVGAAGPDLGGCGGSMVKAVDTALNTITFDDKAMAEVAGKTFTVAQGANVVIDGKPGSLAGVPVGAFVNLSLHADRRTAGQVRAQGPSNVCDCGGSCVTAVDAERRTITFDDKARAEVAGKTFTVAKDANIAIDGKPGTLAALPAGSHVQMNFCVDRRTVGTVFAQGPPVPGVGVVKAVDAERNTVTVEDKTYPVAKDANILFDGKTCRLAGVRAGEYVSLRLCVDRKTVGTIFHTKGP
jgi:RNA polymerase sigma factor (sigma-70 family)